MTNQEYVTRQITLINQQTDLTEFYKSISEVYLAEKEDFEEPIQKIMAAKGILIEIESDLLEFLSKSKPTKKSNKQEERIFLLNSILDYFSRISTTNYQMKLMLRKSSMELAKEKKKREEAERALNVASDLLNAQ